MSSGLMGARTLHNAAPHHPSLKLITEISSDFLLRGKYQIDDLSSLAIPLQLPARCECFYEAIRPTVGSRIAVSINGKTIINLRFDGDAGLKFAAAELTEELRVGENELRVRCLVSCHPMEQDRSDAALLWLKRDDSTVIKKKYTTRGSLEPFDQIWKLWVYR